MSLPLIFVPYGLPCVLAAGHAITSSGIYADIERDQGEGRKRPVATEGLREVPVSWDLSQAQMTAMDDWAEEALEAYTRHFTIEVANQGPGQRYWEACWREPYTAAAYASKTGIRWRVSGVVVLNGTGEPTRPTTGELSVEIRIDLQGSADILGAITPLETEILIELKQTTLLHTEISIALLGTTVPLACEISVDLQGQATLGSGGGVAGSVDSAALDAAFGAVIGSLLYRTPSAWELLLPGYETDVLTMGPVLPYWAESSGGGAEFYAQATPPTAINYGARWVDTDTGILYHWFFDGSTSQWVEF